MGFTMLVRDAYRAFVDVAEVRLRGQIDQRRVLPDPVDHVELVAIDA